jgi:hypothetical protein
LGTAGNTQVSLTWTAPVTNGGYSITNYTVQYSSDNGSTWTTFSRSASSATSATVTDLTSGTTYVFRVAAVTVLGAGAYSTASSSVTVNSSGFTPTAVLLTSGTSYAVPTGATTMKAWAIGAGGGRAVNESGGAGGCAYRTWSVSGGQSVAYAVGTISAASNGTGGNTTVTFSGTTILGNGGSCSTAGYDAATGLYSNGGSYSGGDGGANGGGAKYGGNNAWGGAVGGNSSSATVPNRFRPTDVSGLFSAVSLAGGTTTETGAAAGAFGTGGFSGKFNGLKNAGLGGGGAVSNGGTAAAGGGAVVLYFT